MNMKVVVTTCAKLYWTLRPFAFLFNTFWSSLQEVVIVGYEPIPFQLPDNFSFHSIAPQSYPAKEWSTGLIEFLENFNDDYFIWSFEDYWLVRGVNHPAVSSLESYMGCHPDVLRVDLTGDRLNSGRAIDRGTWGHLDMIETPPGSQYCLSTQMAVMSRRNLLKIMRPHLTPWQYELQDEVKILGELRVMGTRQMPVRYTIGWGTNHKDEDGNLIPNTTSIPKRHLDFLNERDWFTPRTYAQLKEDQ
jgi:hypothetical protein